MIRFSKSAIWNKTYQHPVSHSEPFFHCFTFHTDKWRGINHFLHLNITVDDREAFDVMVAIKVMRVLNQGHYNQEEYDDHCSQ